MQVHQQPPDDLTQSFWQSLQQQMDRTPQLAPWLSQRSQALFERFAQFYNILRWLPRWTRRRWQRKLGASLAGVALALALGNAPVAYAAGIDVTTTVPAINTADGQCSLIEAIINANNDAATYADCVAGNGVDTLNLANDTYELTAINNGQNGLPIITSAITIQGHGATIRRDGPPAALYRIFEVANTGNLTLNETTISGGAHVTGAGIFNNGGILTLNNSTISGNTNEFVDGGGIFNSGGTATLNNSTVSDNVARSGGGIVNSSGTVMLNNSTVSGNVAEFWNGAGIVNRGTMTLINSTVSENSTSGYDSGGVENHGTLTLTNSTISNNQADSGGGLRNVSGTATLVNTIIANSGRGGDCVRNGGTIHASHSLIEGGLGCINGANTNNLTGDPILGSLQNNGGSTRTHALLDGSPAINTGSDVAALDALGQTLTTDQRAAGYPRVLGSAVDLGAYEAAAGCLPFPRSVTDSAELSDAILCFNAQTTAGEYVIALSNDIALNASTTTIDNDDPEISLRIEGNGHTVDGQDIPDVRPFTINPDTTVTLQVVTITRGTGVDGEGGGIFNLGVLTVAQSNIINNTAIYYGGGIANVDGGRLSLVNSMISGNHAPGASGSGGVGGGIFSNSTVHVVNSTIRDNTANAAGGIVSINDGTLSIVNSTISDNSATGSPGVGGGILSYYSGPVSVVNSTIGDNTAAVEGGGVVNFSAVLTLANTIIANNTNGDCIHPDGTINATNSLIGDGLGCVNGTNSNNLTGDPKLGPLQDNGGPTFTRALLSGSPAINQGDNAVCAEVATVNNLDQRAITRPQGVVCDIGAFELVDITPPTASPTQNPPADATGWNNTDVTVTWNWTDNADGSGIDPANCTTSSTSSGEGELTLNATCADLAGNQGSASYTVKVDLIKPTISAAATSAPNPAGWYNSDVTVQFTCADALSGITPSACPASQILNSEGAAVASSVQTVTDAAGNISDPSNVVTVQLDKTLPTLNPLVSPNPVLVGGTATITSGAADALSNLANQSCGALDTSTAGVKSVICTATDNAGNTSNATVEYTVQTAGVLVGSCGGYDVYQINGSYTANGWNGSIKVGTSANNTLNGTNSADLILGLGGNDKLDGKGGDDVLCGGDGVDQVLGAAGKDFLDGGIGNDVLNGGNGDHDSLSGDDGNDTLLDGDGVLSALGGPGNDTFTIALRNGWRDLTNQSRFSGLAAGYGNDSVGLSILGSTRFYLEISGDEPGSTLNPLDGTQDALVFTGRIESNSQIVKFERGVVGAAAVADEEPTSFDGFLVDPTTLTDESGAEFLTEPVGEDIPTEADQTNRVFLPVVTR